MRVAVFAKALSETTVWNGTVAYAYWILKAMARVAPQHEFHLFSNKPFHHHIDAPNMVERRIKIPKMWAYLGFPGVFAWEKFDAYWGLKEVLPLPFFRPPSVITCYDLAIVPGDKPGLMGRFYNWLTVHQALKGANQVIAISESTKSEILMRTGIPSKRVAVTPLAHDDSIFFVPRDRERQKDTPGQPQLGRPYFLCTASSIWYRKNILGVIQAFARFRQDVGTNHRLIITGRKTDPVFYQEVRNTIEALGLTEHVSLPDGVPLKELPDLYRRAEALVFPSFHEGFGMPILEAMACGCPVITSHQGAAAEVAGDGGLLVDPHQPADIALAMTRLVRDGALRSDLVSRGLKRSKNFSWDETARLTARILEQQVKSQPFKILLK